MGLIRKILWGEDESESEPECDHDWYHEYGLSIYPPHFNEEGKMFAHVERTANETWCTKCGEEDKGRYMWIPPRKFFYGREHPVVDGQVQDLPVPDPRAIKRVRP